MRCLLTLLVLPLALGLTLSPAQAGRYLDKQLSHKRVAAAWAKSADALREIFADSGARWPPRGLFIRAFKDEGELELWALPAQADEERPKARVLVHTFPICEKSGDLGPKRQVGDGQVPEGFYTVDRFNPWSSFHLSLGLDYPNAVDRARARGVSPGGDIFIHGKCVTIGCMPLTDGPMELLYLAAIAARDKGQRKIPVHTFPCRMGEEACQARLDEASAADEDLRAFWRTLRPGYDAFEGTRVPPAVEATRDGYVYP